MTRQTFPAGNQLLYWLVAALLIISVSIADAALVAVVASAITVAQLIVIAFTIALIDGGVFFTAWQMRNAGHVNNDSGGMRIPIPVM
jgi:hypothetical protein